MVNKELKKLGRKELVDIIYQLKKNEQEMQEELSALREELQEKRLKLSQAGSIAEASVSITGVFSEAQKSADLYLQEIAQMKENAEKEYTLKIELANKTVEKILAEGEKKYNALRTKYLADYKKWQQLKAEIKRLEK